MSEGFEETNWRPPLSPEEQERLDRAIAGAIEGVRAMGVTMQQFNENMRTLAADVAEMAQRLETRTSTPLPPEPK